MTHPTEPARVGTGGRTCNRLGEPHVEHVTGTGSRRAP
jgi:hypothetical protein